MRKRRTYLVVAVLLVVLVGMMGLAIGCGSSSSSSGGGSSTTPSASSSAGGLTGTAAERAQTILGHAPTGLAATIVNRGTILVANDPNYAPQSYIDPKTKELVGFDVDVAVGMATMLGLKPVWKHPDWNTIPPGLQAGLYDVSIGSMTSAIDGKQIDPIIVYRLKYVAFTPAYYYTTGQIFVKKGGPQITGPGDLAGKTVGVGDGTTYYQWLKDNTKAIVKGYKTDLDAVPDLLNGNIEFWMTAGPTGQQAILQGKPVEFSGKPLYYEDLSMAVKKGETDLLALLSYTVEQMHQDGQLSAMSKKWFNGLDLTVKQ
jgi:polar amino acid transport system substrate-binding protein